MGPLLRGALIFCVLVSGLPFGFAQSLGRPQKVAPTGPPAIQACLTPRDNLQINATSTLCPGYYLVPDDATSSTQPNYGVLRINNNNLALDCAGATLDGASLGIADNGAAIYNPGFRGVVIRNCNIKNYGNFGSGIDLLNASNNGLYRNTVSTNASSSNGPARCIHLRNSSFTNISNNTLSCSNWDIQGGSAGIYLFNSSKNTLRDNVVRNISILSDAFFGGGIVLEGSHDNTLAGNNLSDISLQGLYLLRARGNALLGNFLRSHPRYGIRLANANTSQINDNEVCASLLQDFNLASAFTNVGDNNRCDIPDGWNDTGTTGCTFGCGCTATVATATGTGNATFYTDGCNVIAGLRAVNESNISSQDKPPYKFPHGLFAFNVTGVAPGSTVVVNIVLPQALPLQSQYWKYGPNPANSTPHWYPVPIGDNDGDTLITATLVDGGLGDDDLAANGRIVDVGGPAVTCEVPYDNFLLNTSTVLCSGTYFLNDGSPFGVLIANASNINITCNGTTIDGGDTGRGASVTGLSNVTIEGCAFRDYQTGIYASASPRLKLVNNNLRNNTLGIYLANLTRALLRDNEARANARYGILALNTNLSNFSRNEFVAYNPAGLALAASSNNTLSNNTADDGLPTGILLLNKSGNNTVRDNNFTFNEHGLLVQSSRDNTVRDNYFASNNRSGLFINFSSVNSATGNSFTGNRVGLAVGNNSDDNTIDNNNGSSSTVADISLSSDSNGNAGCNYARDIEDFNSNEVYSKPFANHALRMNTTLCRLVYSVTDEGGEGVFTFSRNNITLDCNNATLVGNGSGTAIHLSFSDYGITARNCRIQNYQSGITVVNGPRNNTLANNTVTSVELGISATYDSQFNTIAANTVTAADDGILLYRAGNNTVKGNTVSATGAVGTGIALRDAAKQNRVANNTVKNTLVGVQAYLASTLNIIEGNFIYDNRVGRHNISNATRNLTVGVHLDRVNNNTVQNNTIANMTDAGVLLTTANRSVVRDNNITNVSLGHGVRLERNATDNTVDDNRVTRALVGILASQSNSNGIDYNNVSRNNYGIRIENASQNIMWFNFIEDSAIYGLHFLRNASDNVANANHACYNNASDIRDDFLAGLNLGGLNTCETTGGTWDDTFETGCSSRCPRCTNAAWDYDGEGGVDCEGYCRADCPDCVPAFVYGPDADKIDIVFIPDKDYQSPATNSTNLSVFREAVWNATVKGYYNETTYLANRCKFNVWYIKKAGDYVGFCETLDLSNARRKCPFAEHYGILHPVKNVTTDARDCSTGDKFSARAPRTAVHETAHNVFGLKDEYCCDMYGRPGDCPNTYTSLASCQNYAAGNALNASACFNFCPPVKCWPNSTAQIANCTANITGDFAANPASKYQNDTAFCNCTAFAASKNFSASDCTPINPIACPVMWAKEWRKLNVGGPLTIQSPHWCKKDDDYRECCDGGRWNLDPHASNPVNPAGCLMSSTSKDFGPADLVCVNAKLGALPACVNNATAATEALDALATAHTAKAVIVTLRLSPASLTKSGAEVVYGGTPSRLVDFHDFEVSALSALNATLENYSIPSPRAFHIHSEEEDEETVYAGVEQTNYFLDDVTFEVVLRFQDTLNALRIADQAAGQVLGIVDLQPELHAFCQANPNDADCLVLDTDGDGAVNLIDNCPFIANNQTDADADGYGAACDCNDANPGISPGDPDRCYNDVDDDCDGVVNDGCGRGGSPWFKKEISA